MPKLHLDWSDGRYYTRPLTDEEAAESEAHGGTVVYLEDHLYEAYRRDCERDGIWQAFWRSIANEQYMRRREKELMPLEDAEREIARLKEELARAERMWKHFEGETTRVRSAVRGHLRESREWTCVFPQPGCNVELLPPTWRERASEILAKYNHALAAEGMLVQGCCCGHEHQRLHDATVVQLRAAGFIVDHDSDSCDEEDQPEAERKNHPDHRRQYDEYTCIYPQPGCQIEALKTVPGMHPEWIEAAQEIMEQRRFAERAAEGLKYQGCCCGHKHLLLGDADAEMLRGAGFIVENDTEAV